MRQSLVAFLLGVLLATPALAGETLSTIKTAGTLRCGVSTGVPGFSEHAPDDQWHGLDIDFCRAVAAAVLGDPTKVAFKALPSLARFPALMSGEIDLLARNTTWTVGREATMGIVFTGPLLYSLQGVMVPAQSGIRALNDLNDKTVCVVKGSTQDASLLYWAKRRHLQVAKKSFDSDEAARKAYFEGACQAYASDGFLLAAARLHAPDGADSHNILLENEAMDPLSPAVRRNDPEWTQIVRSVWASLLLAEEMGLTQASFSPDATPSDAAAIFIEKADALAKALDIPPGWASRAVAAVGNYGEMYDRHLGAGSPLRLPRGPNRLWSAGGLMLPPNF